MSDTRNSHHLLWTGFLRSCEQFPARGAIDVAGREVTYQQLADLAKRLAATLQAGAVPGAVPLTAVFAYRSETAYAACERRIVIAPEQIFGQTTTYTACRRLSVVKAKKGER